MAPPCTTRVVNTDNPDEQLVLGNLKIAKLGSLPVSLPD
jgi:hypothetical protein